MSGADEYTETRAERRARKQRAKRERMAVHGGALRQTFLNATLNAARKRLRRKRR
jgi:hypothetical protein